MTVTVGFIVCLIALDRLYNPLNLIYNLHKNSSLLYLAIFAPWTVVFRSMWKLF
jgi:hypothetical protein